MSLLNRPPPVLLLLPLTVQFVSETAPVMLYRPPPIPKPEAVVLRLPLTVQLISVSVPELNRPPPLLVKLAEVLPVTTQSVRVSVPLLITPVAEVTPKLSLIALPPVIVNPEKAARAPALT